MSQSITYTSTVADEHYPTKLLITPEGLGKLSLGNNRDRRQRAVGQFQQAIPAKLLQSLLATLKSAEFAASPAQKSLVPDESYREIKLIAADQKQTVKLIGEELATPPAFGRAEQTIQDIVDYLQKFPILSVAMRVVPLPQQITAGKPVNIDIVLRNVGRTPYYIESPKEWGKQATQCELKAIRSDVPLAELGSQHQRFVQLDGKAFVKSEPEPTEARWGLMPGAQIGFRFQQAVDWPPGRYTVDLSLALTAFAENQRPLFVGGLASEPQTVEVVQP